MPNPTTSSGEANNREEERKAAKWVSGSVVPAVVHASRKWGGPGGGWALRDLVTVCTECEVRLGGAFKRTRGRWLQLLLTERGPLGKDWLSQ